MALLSISFEDHEESFSVQRFEVREALSALFEVSVVFATPREDLSLASIAGRSARFHLQTHLAHGALVQRTWQGVCASIEQSRVEANGLSLYTARIVPLFWLLTQRRDRRVFQLMSAVEIVETILRDWGMHATWRGPLSLHPKLEYRVQHDETDHAFISRMLEEAGITYYFDTVGEETQLALSHAPHLANPRAGAIRFVDAPNDAAEREYVTEVSLSREARPTRVVVRGADFRRGVEVPLEVHHGKDGMHPRAETYVFAPQWFFVESERRGATPAADDRGAIRAEEKWGTAHAERLLSAEGAGAAHATFRTNAADLSPGTVFELSGHPRSDLAEKALLITEMTLLGGKSDEWTLRGRAVLAEAPYRPSMRTEKPRIHGLETAMVVGPENEEIHTDEHGRVRVQFLWDRYGSYNQNSSCWIRVSQGWAGVGMGHFALPRVGQEVLVSFLAGDPDQPVIVGRLFNGTTSTPYKLPQHRTVSAWRTASSPATGGYSEIRFDDARGAELLHIRAERHLTKVVQLDETEETGAHRTIRVGRRLTLTTGRASIVLDGPDISIVAEGKIDVRAAHDIDLRGERGVWLHDVEEEQEVEPIVPPHVLVYSESIEVHGTEEFRRDTAAALDRLNNTESGERLLASLDAAGEPITIVAAKSARCTIRPLDVGAANRKSGGAPASGTGSHVAYHPQFRPGGAPPEAVLAFALSQAQLSAYGLRETGLHQGRSTGKGKTGGRKVYRDALRTENEVRREMGLPRRARY